MSKRVVSIGQCGPDHAVLSAYIRKHFDAEVIAAQRWEDAEPHIESGEVDLVLVNRKLDVDYSDGLEIIRRMRADDRFSGIPCMLVTNYPEHQQAAVEAGADPGFGKLQYDDPATREKLARFLS